MSESIKVERREAIATVIINRPERRNALDQAAWVRLGEVMAELNADDSLRCIVLRGAGGKAFAAGADISEFDSKRASAEQAAAYAAAMHPALEGIAYSLHPTVAAIEGACTGGGLELAVECDLRLCNASARLGIPINRLGHILPFEGMVPLVQTVGRAVALEMLLEGRVFDARESYEKGLVNRVVADDAFEAELTALTGRIAAGAPLAARGHKAFSRRALDPAPLSEEERLAPFAACDTEDYREGVRAFLEKRKPSFRAR